MYYIFTIACHSLKHQQFRVMNTIILVVVFMLKIKCNFTVHVYPLEARSTGITQDQG